MNRTPAAPIGSDVRHRLTPAETDVAALVATGASNGAIGEQLGISRYTVESHLKHIFTKLGLRNRVELAVWFAGSSV